MRIYGASLCLLQYRYCGECCCCCCQWKESLPPRKFHRVQLLSSLGKRHFKVIHGVIVQALRYESDSRVTHYHVDAHSNIDTSPSGFGYLYGARSADYSIVSPIPVVDKWIRNDFWRISKRAVGTQSEGQSVSHQSSNRTALPTLLRPRGQRRSIHGWQSRGWSGGQLKFTPRRSPYGVHFCDEACILYSAWYRVLTRYIIS